MSLFRALSCVLGFALLAATAGARPGDAASDTDLSWIGKLPGFSLKDPAEVSYLVAGDATAAWEALKKGLTERGWQIVPGKSSTLSALSAQRMTATKGNVEALLHLKQAAVIVKLVVTTRTLEGAPAAAAAASAPAAAKAPPAPAKSSVANPDAGAAIELYDNGLRGSYRCDASRVSVNGNNGDITLEGSCDSVTVNGNSNRVRISARVGVISVLGNQNTVTWSKAGNAAAPKVSNLGTGSTVRAE